MNDEKLKILEMVKEGTISADEGLKLLEALGDEAVTEKIDVKKKSKWIRVKVIEDGTPKVNVNIPISLAKIGLKIAEKYSNDAKELEKIDFDDIFEMIKQGAEGKIVEIEDGNTLVEIYVD